MLVTKHIYRQIGFTIVELLIVIVVIGILAAVSIAAYNGIQNRAADTSIKSDLRSFVTKVEIYKAEHGYYPSMDTNELDKLDWKVTKSAYGYAGNAQGPKFNLMYCIEEASQRYIIYAFSPSGKGIRFISGDSIKEEPPQGGGGFAMCDRVGVVETNPANGRRALDNIWYSWVE